MDTEKFSYYLPPVFNTIPDRSLTLREVWEYISGQKTLQVRGRSIKTGTTYSVGTLEEVTRKVRSLKPEEYKGKRGNFLPFVTFGGVFKEKNTSGLLEASGLLCLDIDHIDELNKPGADVEALREQLSQDKEIGLRLLFISPSGKGLKLICKTSGEIIDNKSYTREFRTLETFISKKYNIPIEGAGLDDNTKDITRNCYLCYDPQSLYFEEGEFRSELPPLPVPEEPERAKKELLAGGCLASNMELNFFRNEVLIPALFSKMDEVFPSMNFRFRRNEWQSPYNLDGTEPKTPRPDKSVITKAYPGTILENGEGKPISVIDKYMTDNSLSPGEAIKQLSRLAGLENRYNDLIRKYAQEMNNKDSQRREKPSTDKSIAKEEKVAQSGSEKQTPEERYRDYLTIPSLKVLAQNKKTGIVTPYSFYTEKGEKEERYTLTSGGLNIVGAMSSHGKSRFLQNLALRLAEEEGEGSVLYFALEENEIEVLSRLANIAADTLNLYYTKSNTEAILEYFRTDGGEGVSWCRDERKEALDNFRKLYEEGKLRVFYTPDLQSAELCKLIEYLSGELRAKAVFVDYLQAITPGGYNNNRTDELRKVCRSLTKTAKILDIPVVLAAQLNRATKNPTTMSVNNLAESADIARYADTALLLWDSAKSRDIDGGVEAYKETREGGHLRELGFDFNDRGSLYAVLDKNRGGRANLEAVWRYTPVTGKIETPEETQKREKKEGKAKKEKMTNYTR